MARTRQQKRQVGSACSEYRIGSKGECEVSRFLVEDRGIARQMSNVLIKGLEAHHIQGRRQQSEMNWWCNIILIGKPAHVVCHDHKPAHLFIACVYAKWRMHIEMIEKHELLGMNLSRPENMRQWEPSAMGRLSAPYVSLAGKIGCLMSKVSGTVFERYGSELLKELEGMDEPQ